MSETNKQTKKQRKKGRKEAQRDGSVDKGIATKTDNLSSIPATHRVGGENRLLLVVL